jgi:DNA-directed RNA polymerase II subunit RPB11
MITVEEPHSRRVEFKMDTKVANAGTFVIQREDHTIGNLVRM